ncbi:hypothetical protein PoB_003760800 [Plakobranchus ocellatus]|uniref:Uncharacterized protein n=1 Tax=Plakobranchus ocellatus TaxID=259542 RepID=A0AAV4AW95_9GAST|nr:hypothetical protein PoB_003760800 [Plakobranchus ocellatus]
MSFSLMFLSATRGNQKQPSTYNPATTKFSPRLFKTIVRPGRLLQTRTQTTLERSKQNSWRVFFSLSATDAPRAIRDLSLFTFVRRGRTNRKQDLGHEGEGQPVVKPYRPSSRMT